MKSIIELTGKNPEGPQSAIFVGVHGNEPCGIDALKKQLPNLQIDFGTLYLVFANPKAIKENRRFVEMNLNRAFKHKKNYSIEEKNTYEFKRAKTLKKILKGVDVLLDIHSSDTPESKPFVICEKNADQLVKYLPVETIVYGFDIVQPGGTDYYMNSIGKIGICIECGNHLNKKSAEIAELAINNFLSARGHIKNMGKEIFNQKKFQVYNMHMTQTNSFKMAKDFADFEKVSKGTLLAKDGKNEIRVWEDSIILFPENRKKIGQEGFLLGRQLD